MKNLACAHPVRTRITQSRMQPRHTRLPWRRCAIRSSSCRRSPRSTRSSSVRPSRLRRSFAQPRVRSRRWRTRSRRHPPSRSAPLRRRPRTWWRRRRRRTPLRTLSSQIRHSRTHHRLRGHPPATTPLKPLLQRLTPRHRPRRPPRTPRQLLRQKPPQASSSPALVTITARRLSTA